MVLVQCACVLIFDTIQQGTVMVARRGSLWFLAFRVHAKVIEAAALVTVGFSSHEALVQ